MFGTSFEHLLKTSSHFAKVLMCREALCIFYQMGLECLEECIGTKMDRWLIKDIYYSYQKPVCSLVFLHDPVSIVCRLHLAQQRQAYH